MSSVSVNPPKTPVTKGSNGTATATIPNVCKMPGPPAPFVPAPLPNIGKSALSPKGYSTSVTIEGQAVAIKGATFESIGDMASKATGGGMISANAHGITKFLGPGSMDVKIEGKNVQLLSDPMLNNCGPSGSPPNSATLLGVVQVSGLVAAVEERVCPLCGESSHAPLEETAESKADAKALEDQYAPRHTKLAKTRATMLGVVHCKCARKYADQSGRTTTELCDAADALGMKHHKAAPDIKAMMKNLVGNDDVFDRVWEQAEEYSDLSKEHKYMPIGYPPGACAAQGALVLALDDRGVPAAVTERWYSPSGKPVGRPIWYVNAQDGVRRLDARQFGPGDTVPPCQTCEVILPLLLCFKKEVKCSHGS